MADQDGAASDARQSSFDGTKNPKAPNAALMSLQKPEKLSKILKDDKYDCLSCRLMGSAAMFGLGGYIYYSGRQQLQQRGQQIIKQSGSTWGIRSRMLGLTTLSSTFVVMGIYRLVN